MNKSEQNENICLLKTEALSKTYVLEKVKVPVLKNVSFSMKTGESVAIIGASGAGKSTLLHIIGGLEQPTTGSVFFNNQNLYLLSNSRRSYIRAKEIGFIFQFYHLLPELDVRENVLLPYLALKSKTIDENMFERAEMLIKAVGLEHRMRHLPSELSGGEQQRAAVARALMNKPLLLLADEPTGNLDSTNGKQVLDILFNLVETEKCSLVMVTHSMDVAKRCERVMELKDGVLL